MELITDLRTELGTTTTNVNTHSERSPQWTTVAIAKSIDVLDQLFAAHQCARFSEDPKKSPEIAAKAL